MVRRTCSAALGAALLLAALGLANPAKAQSIRELRGRLSAAQGAPGAAVPVGALRTIEHQIDVAERIEDRFAERAPEWRARAARWLTAVEAGDDPLPAERGKIIERGYRSVVSPNLQGYAIYVPPDYDPSRSYPLYVALHGGSSNGNLFLGVVLGNNMDWLTYNEHLYDEYTPRWSPDWIVVAPTGFGQIMWRWMGEQDVLDVIDDVERHYNVDHEQVVLGGVSNGGVGAYTIGSRHAWRFSSVQAMAGAPSWLQYVGGRLLPEERRDLSRYSAMEMLENTRATDFRYYHGRTDTGPMRPAFTEALDRRVATMGLPMRGEWYDMGHDILYRVHRHGRVYTQLAEVHRDPRPSEVIVVTGDYRANRQHWLTVTRIDDYPTRARVRGVVEGSTLTLETSDASAFRVDLTTCPLPGDEVRIVVDTETVYEGHRADLGHRLHLVREADAGDTGRWRTGFPVDAPGLAKRPGLSGPVTDAYYGRMVHVYGTQNNDHTRTLERAAKRGARGWPLWAWNLGQEVIPDTAVTAELMHEATLVLYGSPGDNSVLERLSSRLPIQVEEGAVVVGADRYEGRDVGVRFIYPNPEAPERYLVVQAAVSPDIVRAGNKLPEFIPDYMVYDGRTVRGAQRRATGRNRPRALGYFDARWRLPGAGAEGSGPDAGGPTAAVDAGLPVPVSPAVPERPRRFAAGIDDQAGRAARSIWRRVPTFINFRAAIGGANWVTDRRARWTIRPTAECMAELERLGVPARPRPDAGRPVPAPVEITGPIDGVWFRMTHEERPIVVSCEMAAALPELVRIVKERGVTGIEILSALRTHPRTSFHTMGLGLDLSRFWTEDGWLSVEDHYEATPMARTCSRAARPRPGRARTLWHIACDVHGSRLFSSVLTPNYNEGHRDHFHIDRRPDDARFFLR